MPSDFDFFDPEFQANVHPHFARMREECPMAHAEEPFDWYAVTREKDVRALLHDWKNWTSELGPGLSRTGGGVLVSVDPPEHTFDRRLVNRAFTPASLLAMEPQITELIDEIIDGFVERGEGDFMEMLAVPVPLIVIAWLLGLDPDLVQQMRPRADAVISADALQQEEMARQLAAQAGEADRSGNTTRGPAEVQYFLEKIAERRAMYAAGEEMPQDTLTALVTAELNGRTLRDDEIVGFMGFLFIAGSATTTQLIGNMVYRLLQNPDQMELAKNYPDLYDTCVEESLRYDSPVNGLFRTAVKDQEFLGVEVPKDTKVLCMFGSANLDPEMWEDPEKFDVTRDYEDLKLHYAFGQGIHYCMGAPLARVEAKVALKLVLERMPNLRLTGEPTEISAPVMHGVETLPVAWDAPAGN
ncbi:MAG: cytochrome P450 [Chloroflexi bacterium]|nr:cytochrome P450 [Chloroflexota bacterium]